MYPLNDAQLERIVRLALGKRVLEATAATAGRGPLGATTSVVRTVGSSQAGPEVMSDDGSESHGTDSTEPEGPPLASRATRPTSSRSGEAAAVRYSEASTARQPSEGPPNVTTTRLRSRVGKRRAKQLGGLPEQLWRLAV
jgi:hypothetical protein